MAFTLTRVPDRAGVPPPDIVWDGTIGDFAPATLPEHGPRGGLRGGQALATAALMLLMTDVRASADDLRPEHGGDARGWAGDGFDVDAARGERPLGSRLWLYRRSVVDDDVARAVEEACREALQPLIDQGAAVRCEAVAVPYPHLSRLDVRVALFGRDGALKFSAQFDDLWKVLDGVSAPLAP